LIYQDLSIKVKLNFRDVSGILRQFQGYQLTDSEFHGFGASNSPFLT